MIAHILRRCETHAEENNPVAANKTNATTETKLLLARLRLFNTQWHELEGEDRRRPC